MEREEKPVGNQYDELPAIQALLLCDAQNNRFFMSERIVLFNIVLLILVTVIRFDISIRD